MAKHLIVMSVDAMVFEDLAHLKDQPCFGKMMREGSMVEKMLTIYPSATHPVHVSIMTGCYPDRTGVPSNHHFAVGRDAGWYNDFSDVQVPTIFHAAKAAGMTTCACRWPVTSNAGKIIDYLVPEILSDDLTEEPYRRQGTDEALLRDIVGPALRRQDPKAPRHPAYETMEIECAAEIIRRYQPNLVFCHPGQVDSTRHAHGLFNSYVDEALDLSETYLAMLMEAAQEAGIYDDTDFVVLSDHGHLNIQRQVCPNVLLADAGFIRADDEGNIADWDAYIQSCGLSAHVMLKNPDDPALTARVEEYLRYLCSEGVYGFTRVLTAEEAEKEYHLRGRFSFVLESDGFSGIGEACVRPIVRQLNTADYRSGHSTHGHAPEKGPQPPFLCMGPDFRCGVVLPHGKIVDEAPTMARAMGLSMPGTDGSAIEELLR